MKKLAIILSISPLLPASTNAADPVREECDLSLKIDRQQHVVTLSLTDTNAQRAMTLNHWRMDGSSDLARWSRMTSLDVYNGFGQTELLLTDLESGSSQPTFFAFFQAHLDNSVENVLTLPDSAYNYARLVLPPHLRGPQEIASDNTPENNPVTDNGATLGRVLFYDKKLSKNYTVSCASCHQQAHGFSDPSAFSTGFEGGLTGRNSMSLTNAKFYTSGHFFWDERAATLEVQSLQPIQNEVEMGMDLPTLVARLQSYEYYQTLFTAAFGDSTVTSERIALSLSQFVRSILSYQSKFDQGVATNFSNFTEEENLGRQIFNGPRGNCATCHSGPNFVGTRIENNGLEFPFVDLGVGGVTERTQDNGKFKMSSLRNIEKTGPYMHDGRHSTLEEVIDHYSNGVIDNPSLGPTLRNPGGPGPGGNVRRPNFTTQEKQALVAFLKTLTDFAVLTDPKFASPFAQP